MCVCVCVLLSLRTEYLQSDWPKRVRNIGSIVHSVSILSL